MPSDELQNTERRIRVDFDVNDTQVSLQAFLRRLAVGDGFASDTVIDLSESGFLGPVAVSTLVGLRRLALTQGHRVSIRPPEKPKLRSYCQYAGLLKEFDVPYEDTAYDGEVTTTPVAVFANGLPIAEIENVVGLASRTMKLSSTARHDLKLTMTELLQNVLDHSESPVGGVISAKAFKNEREVRLAVADFGVGFRKSLEPAVVAKDDKEAIRMAVQEGITGKSTSHNMGLGLSHLSDIARLAGGRLVLYSKLGFLNQEGGRNKLGLVDVPFPGTMAFLRLPLRDEAEAADDTADAWDW